MHEKPNTKEINLRDTLTNYIQKAMESDKKLLQTELDEFSIYGEEDKINELKSRIDTAEDLLFALVSGKHFNLEY